MNLLRAIQSGVWMLHPAVLESYLPLALRLVQGENVSFPVESSSSFAVRAGSGREYELDAPPPKSVAVHSITGVITKFDQYCAPPGMETLMRQMRRAEGRENIIGHVLSIDSGGGEATNIETVARMIRQELKKPVVAHFNGYACSAAYYIAAAADEIYASEPTDIAGSIGVMITFADFRKFWEEKGVKIHEVYAEESKLKNEDIREALEENYDKLKTGLLNPYAQQFIKTVKEFRPQLQAEEAYQGRVYTAPDAHAIGMIDGQMTFEQAVERVFFLHQNNSTNMNKTTIEGVLGYKLETQDGGVFLNADEVAKVSAALQQADEASPERMAAATDQLAAISTRLDAIAATQEKQAESIAAQNTKLQELAAKPGASATGVATEEDPALGDDDVLAALEKQARAAAENGGPMRVAKQ